MHGTIHIILSVQDWTTDFNLFESGVKTNPSNVKLRNNYAMELKSANRITEARAQYEVRMMSANLSNTPAFGRQLKMCFLAFCRKLLRLTQTMEKCISIMGICSLMREISKLLLPGTYSTYNSTGIAPYIIIAYAYMTRQFRFMQFRESC